MVTAPLVGTEIIFFVNFESKIRVQCSRFILKVSTGGLCRILKKNIFLKFPFRKG